MLPQWFADTQDFEDVVFTDEDVPYEVLTDVEDSQEDDYDELVASL